MGRYIFYLTLIFACGYANAGSIAKRQTAATSNLLELIETVVDLTNELPFVGPDISNAIKTTVGLFEAVEVLTNGAISKLLNGILPCEISLQGLSCSGLTPDALTTLLTSTIDDIPSMILPDVVKSLLNLVIEMFIDPVLRVLFGSGA